VVLRSLALRHETALAFVHRNLVIAQQFVDCFYSEAHAGVA
jgi:hypothetical protein